MSPVPSPYRPKHQCATERKLAAAWSRLFLLLRAVNVSLSQSEQEHAMTPPLFLLFCWLRSCFQVPSWPSSFPAPNRRWRQAIAKTATARQVRYPLTQRHLVPMTRSSTVRAPRVWWSVRQPKKWQGTAIRAQASSLSRTAPAKHRPALWAPREPNPRETLWACISDGNRFWRRCAMFWTLLRRSCRAICTNLNSRFGHDSPPQLKPLVAMINKAVVHNVTREWQ